MSKAIDLTGMRFGHWTVLERAGSVKYESTGVMPTWLCRCDCGKERVVLGKKLKNGRSQSCGCFRKDRK